MSNASSTSKITTFDPFCCLGLRSSAEELNVVPAVRPDVRTTPHRHDLDNMSACQRLYDAGA
jgi:hypothetical protein